MTLPMTLPMPPDSTMVWILCCTILLMGAWAMGRRS